MIRVTIDFRDAKRFDNLIRYIDDNLVYAEAQEQMRILGHHTADYMREVINVERKRPTKASHKLDNAITAETLSTVGGVEVGIGRISTLNAQAPYWEMINDGANYSTKRQHIVPFEDGGFRTFKIGSTHTIEGIDFVGRGIRNLDQELRDSVEKLGTKFINGVLHASNEKGSISLYTLEKAEEAQRAYRLSDKSIVSYYHTAQDVEETMEELRKEEGSKKRRTPKQKF